jgi:hypothetical protein
MSSSKLAQLMVDFTESTILGVESGMYKTIKHLLKENNIKQIQYGFCVEYYNSAYRSLILNNDTYFVEKFTEMHQELSHSYICLLNIIFTISLRLIDSIDRNKLDDSTYDKYIKSVQKEIKKAEFFKVEYFEPLLSHTCSGTDIKTCNPDEPLFFIK